MKRSRQILRYKSDIVTKMVLFGYWLAITLRFVLMSTSSLDSGLERPELSSPVTSYKRLTEGIREGLQLRSQS